MTKEHRIATDLIHAGRIRTNLDENAEALFLTSSFVYESAELAEDVFNNKVPHYQYSRFSNPTVVMLEQKLAKIEGAEMCRCTATGMAAVNAALLCGLGERALHGEHGRPRGRGGRRGRRNAERERCGVIVVLARPCQGRQ